MNFKSGNEITISSTGPSITFDNTDIGKLATKTLQEGKHTIICGDITIILNVNETKQSWQESKKPETRNTKGSSYNKEK